MTAPLVSVILPVFNGEKYLAEAITSILQQTHENLELIIINDGSSDSTPKITSVFSAKDSRIRAINKSNEGLVNALNDGLDIISGEYICRMDADDIAEPSRIEEQINYMQKHNLDVCGSNIIKFNSSGKNKIGHFPETHQQFCENILSFGRLFAHPATIFTRRVFEQFRYSDCLHIEDYALWLDIFTQSDFRMANCPSPLLKYRTHEKQVSRVYKSEQQNSVIDVFWKKMLFVDPKISRNMCEIHFSTIKSNKKLSGTDLTLYANFLRILLTMCIEKSIGYEFLKNHWVRTCSNSQLSYKMSSEVCSSLKDIFDEPLLSKSPLKRILSSLIR